MLKTYLTFLFFVASLTFLCTPIVAQTCPEVKNNPLEVKKTAIKVIAFDFGGVIAKGNREEVNQFISKALNVPMEAALKARDELKAYTRQGKGKEIDFWIAYAKSNGIKLPENWQEQLDQARLKALKEIPGMVNLVKNLQKQGFQTALLSNVRLEQARVKSQLGFYKLFNPILLSYQTGIHKPHPQAYYQLLDELHVPADELLFVDNKPENIKGAQAVGIDAILFSNVEQLIKELKQRGIDVSSSH